MQSQPILSTVLKKYEKIDNNTYKILISCYSGKHNNITSLTEKDFSNVIEASILNNKAQVIPNTLVDYYGLENGKYKTCFIRARKEVIPASNASFASMVENKGFKKVTANVFVDSTTNKIWKKTVSDSGTIQLVQTQEEDLEQLMRNRLDVSAVVAFSRPFYSLNPSQFDYVYFYNPQTEKVESGITLGENEKGQKVIASRQLQKNVEISSHCVILCGAAQELKDTLEKDLKGAKSAADVMQAYINAWYKSADGADYANKTEKILKTELLSKASVESGEDNNSISDEVFEAIDNQQDKSGEKINKEEIEAVLATKFDKTKMTCFAFVEKSSNSEYNLKFTKPIDVDDVLYVQSTLENIFKTSAKVTSTKDFINFKISI